MFLNLMDSIENIFKDIFQDLRRELLYEKQCSAAKNQQIATMHVKLAVSTRVKKNTFKPRILHDPYRR